MKDWINPICYVLSFLLLLTLFSCASTNPRLKQYDNTYKTKKDTSNTGAGMAILGGLIGYAFSYSGPAVVAWTAVGAASGLLVGSIYGNEMSKAEQDAEKIGATKCTKVTEREIDRFGNVSYQTIDEKCVGKKLTRTY